MKRFWHNNSLSIVVFTIFLLCLIGQTLTGYHVNNEDLEDHNQPPLSMSAYLLSGHFGEAVFENWESEFLQMAAYIVLTVFLFQKGSAESKDPNKKEPSDEKPEAKAKLKNVPWPVRKGGFILKLYKNSLLIAFGLLFLLSFSLHAVEGARQNCSEESFHQKPCDSLVEYATGSQFWFESFQNWQSEFLAVGSIVVLSIFLRQQGSPESKPVAAPHSSTGE
jgi:hypothetical protein